MKSYFGYTRVSTVKQGERGVSMQEQREAILRHATRGGLTISEWFEERETAAKRGRPVFTAMLRLLRKGKASGVIIHKIDRSARNLRDWSDLGELIDQGIEVHFANESLDLHSRGGRLSADIQAVVAADFIRNLREETKKGFYGRLKQGIYPLPAPLGYLDRGKGKPKEIDPLSAPTVRLAFDLYASGRYNLDDLVSELYRRGLRNRHGRPVTRNGLSTLLNNPFYIGLIRLKRTGETFEGKHKPLIPKRVFDRVQHILRGKTPHRTQTHDFVFRRLFTCRDCGFALIAERQKGHVYYRCHTKGCATKGLREEVLDRAVRDALVPLHLTQPEREYVAATLPLLHERFQVDKEARLSSLRLRLEQIQARLARLTDAYLDQTIDKQLFEERKTALLLERKDLEGQLPTGGGSVSSLPSRLQRFLELAGNVHTAYEKAPFPEERRDMVTLVTSNRVVSGKVVAFELSSPFREVAKRSIAACGDPQRDIPRIWDDLLAKLLNWLSFASQSTDTHHRTIVDYLDKKDDLAT